MLLSPFTRRSPLAADLLTGSLRDIFHPLKRYATTAVKRSAARPLSGWEGTHVISAVPHIHSYINNAALLALCNEYGYRNEIHCCAKLPNNCDRFVSGSQCGAPCQRSRLCCILFPFRMYFPGVLLAPDGAVVVASGMEERGAT